MNLANKLSESYQKEYPLGVPIVVACEKGLLEDVKVFVAAHDSVKQMLDHIGTDSTGHPYNTLMASVVYGKTDVLAYLLECGVDPSIVDSNGQNALHLCAYYSSKRNTVINTDLLIDKMSLEAINARDQRGQTPLDRAYVSGWWSWMHTIRVIRKHGGLTGEELDLLDSLPRVEPNPQNLCSICQENYTEHDQKHLLKLECGHIFHKRCILHWMKANAECPVCRGGNRIFPNKYIMKIGEGTDFEGYFLTNKLTLKF